MTKAAKMALVACVVVVLGGGFAFYWFALRDTAPPEAALRTRDDGDAPAESGDGEPADDAAAGSAADGEWVVQVDDPESVFVGYRVLELFAGETVKKEAAGRTSTVTGTMTVAGDQVTEVEMTADLSELKSDDERRDTRVRTEVLMTAQFPEATFVLTEPIDLGGVPVDGEPVTAEAVGELTAHGVTQPVTFTLEARWNGTTIDVAGSTPVVFADFGIDAPTNPVLTVDDQGTIELQLTFVRA